MGQQLCWLMADHFLLGPAAVGLSLASMEPCKVLPLALNCLNARPSFVRCVPPLAEEHGRHNLASNPSHSRS